MAAPSSRPSPRSSPRSARALVPQCVACSLVTVPVVVLALAAAVVLVVGPFPLIYWRSFWCVETEDHVDTRYFRPEVCISPVERTEAITRLVKAMAALLDSRDVDYWVDSGTLLGQFRRQAVIPWDTDADFGVTEQGFAMLRDLEWSVPRGYELQVMDSERYYSEERDWNVPARLVDTALGFYVDVFVFAESQVQGDIAMLGPPASESWANCVHCVHIGRQGAARLLLLPKSYVFPLLRCPFADFTVLCPARRTLYLEHLYGADFRVEKRT